ncbi:hypothetical protein PIB30_110191, partial [Stylosanthes scabra]|nr:hypothetical protein [Stylosanthes scabra]
EIEGNIERNKGRRRKQRNRVCRALPRLDHTMAWARRESRPPNGAMTGFWPCLGVGFHHSPRLGVARSQGMLEARCSMSPTQRSSLTAPRPRYSVSPV